MSGLGGKRFGVRDHSLWDEVRRTIKPLEKAAPAKVAEHSGGGTFGHAPPAPSVLPAYAAAMRGSRETHEPPPLGAFDRRTAQKLSRGLAEPDARIDLHGENLETARMKLLQFLDARRHQGARLVLVITGKGTSPFARHTLHGMTHFHTPEREGRLRREVPQWLHEGPFRIHVVGFQPAHPRHGGGGAFYVRLRRMGERP